MPSQLLHVLFGEDVITEVSRLVKSRFTDNAQEELRGVGHRAFALGCQGPDIFYHNRRRRPVGLEYGTLLHRRGIGRFASELLGLALPAPLAEGIDALGMYALGFMTHAMLDRAAHPFIVYKSFRFAPAKQGDLSAAQSHAFFERIIDTLMLKLLRGTEIARWDQEGLLAGICGNPPPDLGGLLARALVLAFPERAGKDEKLALRIENTFCDSAAFYRMTAPANINGRRGDGPLDKDHLVYVYPESLPDGIDFLNLEKRPWLYPAGSVQEDTRSFPEVYAVAVQAASASLAALMVRCLDEGVFPAGQAAAVIGNGGLSVTDENGAPCPPCRSDPLPLDEVIEQQMHMRRSNRKNILSQNKQ